MGFIPMLKPNSQRARRHWESLSDAQLLDVELSTDDPEGLSDLVFELPPGDEEPYVEYSYDLRGTEREKFRCVHGNHRFVIRKGESRFLVGRICGKTIYGENFDHYKADFKAAQSRQGVLRRVTEIRAASDD